jgi:hypothetical protein
MARITVEDSLRLDVSHPAVRCVLGAGVFHSGVFEWGEGGASIGYIWRPLAQVLELRFIAAGVSVAQRIEVRTAPVRFGGRRLWFECPATRVRTRALFLPPGGRCWAGRIAHDLAYRSQQERPGLFTKFGRALDRDDAHLRRNHVRRLRRRERAREARRA